MRKILYALTGLALLLCCVNSFAQDHEAMMKAWQTYMTPGEMHKMLAQSDGNWTADITMWMEPGKDPIKSKGTMSNKMIMGGRYQESHYAGEFMGQKMEGMGTTGYNNSSKKFESSWLDNMGTGVMMMTGTYDASSKTITFTGNQLDPMIGKEAKIRQTLQMTDADHQMMTMYMTPEGGSEMKTMEIRYTRSK